MLNAHCFKLNLGIVLLGGAKVRNQRRRFVQRRFHYKLLTSLAIVSVFGLMVACGFIMGKFFESLLFLVMWIQLELSLRQMEIYRRGSEPRFTATLRTAERLPSISYLELHNVGGSVARIVGICRVLTKDGEEYIPLDPVIWRESVKTHSADIPPGGSKTIAEIHDASILDRYTLEVCYSTDEGLFRSFLIAKHGENLLVFRSSEELPGPLLSSVRFLCDTLWLRYKLKRYLRTLEKPQKPT